MNAEIVGVGGDSSDAQCMTTFMSLYVFARLAGADTRHLLMQSMESLHADWPVVRHITHALPSDAMPAPPQPPYSQPAKASALA